MQKTLGKPLVYILLIVVFLIPLVLIPSGGQNHSTPYIDVRTMDPESGANSKGMFTPSAGPTETGVLPAIEYQQYGTNIDTTGSISVRTDEQQSVITNLTLDSANRWKSNQVELNVSEIRKLYALNGTFGNGYPGVNVNPSGSVSYYPLGWDADGFNDEPTKQTLRASYDGTGQNFIELEVEGEPTGNPWDFKVFKDSYVFWYQEVTRNPSETEFLLSFDLLYDSGPIGTEYPNTFQLRVEADWGSGSTVLWSLDPVTIPQRDIWDTFGPIPISLTGVPTAFDFRFIFEILEDVTLEGDREDFDDDWDNAQFVRFCVDDISLTAADYSDPEDVNMGIDISPIGVTPINGTDGNGRALVNYSSWESSSLQFEILSDSPVSFEYEARFTQTLRTGNTSWTASPTETGVGYSVDTDTSPVLTSFFYIPDHDNLEEFTLELAHASDYENITILNADMVDVTSSCTLSEGMILINGDVLASLGWWKLTLNAPNYARITEQKFLTPTWDNETEFYPGDRIRSLVEIGTPLSIPEIVDDLSINWILPNGTLWFDEQVSGAINGIAYSSALTLGAYNASSGLWTTRIFWNNGTEIAYGEVHFELFRNSTLTPVNSLIEADSDTIVTCAVYLRDAHTNETLMDDQSTVVGNWSGETIIFQRNLAKSWWEGDLNTSIVGRGIHSIRINASNPYYSSSNCTVTIEVTSLSVFTNLGLEYVELGLESPYEAKFRYSYTDGGGIEDALIEVVSITGPMGGLSYESTIYVPGEIGNYSIEFQVHLGGSYSVVVRASKTDHNTETLTINFAATAIATELNSLNGTSDVITVGANYLLALQYLNSTGSSLSGAEITVVNVVPSSGLSFSSTQYHGNGTYSILIDGNDAGVFSITIRASLDGHDSQIAVFTLVVSPNPSILSVSPPLYSIFLDSNYTLLVTYSNSTYHGLENATISVVSVDPLTGLWYSEVTETGSGLYSITLIPSAEGTYNLVLQGALENFQNSTTVFTLVVTKVPTSLETSDGQVSGFCYFTDSFEILLLYERTDTSALVYGATIEITPIAGLVYTLTEITGGYRLVVNSSLLGTWSLSLKASKDLHRNASMIFDFEVREAVTTLSDGVPPIDLFFKDTYSFVIDYKHNDSIGITNATLLPTYQGNQGEPLFWIDYFNGTYGFTITAGDVGFYVVSIEFSKYGYESQISMFTLVVSPKPSILSTTPSIFSITVDSNYTLSVTFTNSTYHGAENATISIISMEPSTGLSFSQVTEIGSGFYSVTLIPSLEGTYNVILRGVLENYQNSTTLFTLIVSELSTALETSDGQVSGFCYFTDSFEVLLFYARTDNGAIVYNATIEITPIAGLDYTLNEITEGYLLTINPSVLGSWSLSFKAFKTYYRNASMIFDFEVRESITTLTGDGLPEDLYFGVTYNFDLQYNLNNSIGISNASLIQTYRGIQGDPIIWFDYNNGTYGFTMIAGDPGSFLVSIEFSKYGYESFEASFSFTINEVPVIVSTTSIPSQLYESRVYQIGIFIYSNEHGALVDADVIYSNSIFSFIVAESFGNGWFNFTFSPDAGIFSAAVINIIKQGYEDTTIEFPLAVSLIPLMISSEYSLENSYSLIQGRILSLSFQIISTDYREPITDSSVSFLIVNGSLTGTFENHTDGIYTANIPVPIDVGVYTLRISISRAHFSDLEIDVIIVSEVDSDALLVGLTTTGLEVGLFVIGSVAIVYTGRSRYKRRIKSRHEELLEYKSRFSDVNNIIGLIVIHRVTSLPIYYRIIKGGFEMSMISGFISAISNFAEELREKEKLWAAIPISEIVAAVQTDQLICALLTVDSPSNNLIYGLEVISLLLGEKFDNEPELLMKMASATTVAKQYRPEFDQLFEEHFDGQLLSNYTSYDMKQAGLFPLLERTINNPDFQKPFITSDLVKHLVASGIDERRVYALVLKALDEKFLISEIESNGLEEIGESTD